MGNLTRDPDTRVTATGLTICKMGMAVSRNYSTRDGERREETTFVDVDAFGKQAEIITKYMRKGRPIMVEGHLKLDQWETNEGQKRSKLHVVLENFQFIGGPDDGHSSGRSPGTYEQSSPPLRQAPSGLPTEDASDSEDSMDDDVPF